MVLAIDMDGVLCEEGPWDCHEQSIPIRKNIDKTNYLYDSGHEIIIYTGRFHEEQKITQEWLERFGVKYHRLVMGKLLADYYVDDRLKTLEEL